MKRAALIGSSGGNLRNLGGASPAELIGQVRDQLAAAGVALVAVVFVAADRSLDAPESAQAALWLLREGDLHSAAGGSLKEVNALAQAEDQKLAEAIEDGAIDGLVLISADPGGVNEASIAAAVARDLPASGSGGTCVATAEAAGLRFVASSGTTGTTNVTRAITYTAGLAREWGLAYKPASSEEDTGGGSFWQRYDPRPVLSDALPAIVPIGVVLGFSQHLPDSIAAAIHGPLLRAIPVIIAVYAATRISRLGLSGLISGLIAGVIAQRGGLISVLVAGFLAATFGNWLIIKAAQLQWPSTMANIVASGGAGVFSGLLCGYVLGVPSHLLDHYVALGIDRGLASAGLWIGLIVGALMWPLMLRGLYHTVIIPLMVIEMEQRGLSFLATMDVIGLVVAAAGVAAANVWLPRVAVHRRAAVHTLRITLWFGDYVEGVYPFFEEDRRVLWMAGAASTLAGAIAGVTTARSVSYIAPWLVPVIGTSAIGLTAALLGCFAFSFCATSILNYGAKRQTGSATVSHEGS
jgi:hypothetical protein